MAFVWSLPFILGRPSVLFASTSRGSLSHLKLTSPHERQIFQRNPENSGRIAIEGVITPPLSSSAALVVTLEKEDRTPLSPAATLLMDSSDAVGASSRPFHLELSAPAGGWYTLRVRLLTQDKAPRALAAQVKRVGIGEVFLIAGQSNSANYGRPRMRSQDDRVSAYDIVRRRWQRAEDPMPVATGTGGSPWPILGERLARTLKVPIGLVCVGVGSTSVKEWDPASPISHFTRLQAAVKQLRGGFRAVLWHQGETDAINGVLENLSDSPITSEAYRDHLKRMIDRLNQDAGYSIPWIVAHASHYPTLLLTEQGRKQMEVVRAGQERIWLDKLGLLGPDTDDLVGPAYRWDAVHFNQRGLYEHADRWFQAVVQHFFTSSAS